MILSKRFITTVLSLAVMASLNVKPAQGKERAKPERVAEVSIVALGPKPPRRYKQVKGSDAPAMLLARAGEVPPSRLYYKVKQAKEKKTKGRKLRRIEAGEEKVKWRSFNISFNNPSGMKAVPSDQELVLYLKKRGAAEYEKYVTIPAAKAGTRQVVFLLPSTTGKWLWRDPPLVRSISLDSKVLRGKQFILKNFSRFPVMHAFDKSVTEVSPMEMISYKRVKAGELYRLAACYGTQKKILYNTAVRMDGEGHIHLFALYDATPGTNSGRSVGVFRTMISVRKVDEQLREKSNTHEPR